MTDYFLYKAIEASGINYYFREGDPVSGEISTDFNNLEKMADLLFPLNLGDMVLTIPGPRAEITERGFIMEIPLTQKELRMIMRRCKVKE
ncbi:MAG: hypothetical protein NTW17_02235 [Candidatus Pacearchaeota archaeon]|nr:hypothetical protein [Candidatus Pacearchaeota archaeon]